MKVIASPTGFETWAINEFGEKWYNNQDIIDTYGKDQISALYGVNYPAPIKSFNTKEVDIASAERRAKVEYESILTSPNRVRDRRTDEKIYEHTLQGHIAEQYLMDAYQMKDCDLKYHDLVDKDGNIVEVKTSNKGEHLDKQYDRILGANWNKSTRMISFIVNGDNFEFYFDKML
jgi:hypothetical protein